MYMAPAYAGRNQLLRPMRGIVGRIEIDGDQPCAMVQPLRMTFDYALGQRRAHVVKLARTNGIFKARQRRLRSHIETPDRIPAEHHFVHRIGSEPSRWRPHSRSRWRKRAGRKDRATNDPPCPPAADRANSRTCWRSIRSDARPLSTAPRHHRWSPAAGRIPTSPAWRKSLQTTNALLRQNRSSESLSLCLKHCLVNLFVAQEAFANSRFTNYPG